jgi:antitoxin component of RelBE/YafQ-DinJ toxin-antitoxin module
MHIEIDDGLYAAAKRIADEIGWPMEKVIECLLRQALGIIIKGDK